MDLNGTFAEAEAAFVIGDLSRSRKYLLVVLSKIEDHPSVLHLLALVEKGLGDSNAAKRLFQRALKIAPQDAQINENYANLLSDLAEFDDALTYYGRAIAASRSAFSPLLNRSLLLRSLGRPADALRDIDAATLLAPSSARLLAARGAVLRDLEQLDAAAAAFDAALALEPQRAAAQAGRARIALERGEMDAADRYRSALTNGPDDVDLLLGLAQALEAAGQANATTFLEEILIKIPTWADGHVQLARMRSEEGEGGDPARSFIPALAAHPSDQHLSNMYWQTLLRAGRFDDVLSSVTTARVFQGDHRALLIAEATALSEIGDAKRAEEVFNRLPEGADTNLTRARHFLRTGDPARSGAVLSSHLQTNPRDIAAWAHMSLVWRLMRDDRHEWLVEQPGLSRFMDLDLPPEEIHDLADLLRTLHRTRSHPIGQSLRGGTQTRGRLFARMEAPLRRLKIQVEEMLADYVSKLPPRDETHPLLCDRDRPFVLAGSWSVRLRESGFHVNHIHPDGAFSSAFYVALPNATATTEARDGWLELGGAPAELGLALKPLTLIEPKPGRLALFPSFMFHGTRPFRSGERLTIAFDVRAA